ncbi:hypothetical protein [Flagellimonas eckloniae]|uniref:hypothetical protein n=1 Tax=Flagellimonas eckloniae TaxID=346185 RepID=UPI0006DCCE93|nr:hypothetical protein [Allomuricauda eckloniae]
MESEFDIHRIITSGIQNELDLQRALIASRLLRIMAKENSKLRMVRTKLRDLIIAYEYKNWSRNSNITQKQIEESDLAESMAEKEIPLIRQSLIKNFNISPNI